MNKEIRYGNWDKSYGFGIRDGNLYSYCGSGLAWHEMQYVGKGKPSACQAARQNLLLGTFDMNGDRQLKETDVLFGIRAINHSYDDWTGDIFKDYTIDILQGTKEDVEKCFDNCVICCSECSGCGGW